MAAVHPERVATQAVAFPALVADESRWVDEIRGGDAHASAAAFNAMFRAYAAPLAAFAKLYLGSPDDAADAVQDVFVAIWRRARTWGCRGTVREYLYGAVRNEALTRLRRGRVRARAAEQLLRDAAGAEDVAAPVFRVSGEVAVDPHEVRLALLESALGKLSDKHRQVFLLRWQHGLTYAEIGAVLDIPVKTVDSRMVRALQAIRRHVTARGQPDAF
jgi:RNA polymerase sigma-70 factor, ECF subfamily